MVSAGRNCKRISNARRYIGRRVHALPPAENTARIHGAGVVLPGGNLLWTMEMLWHIELMPTVITPALYTMVIQGAGVLRARRDLPGVF